MPLDRRRREPQRPRVGDPPRLDDPDDELPGPARRPSRGRVARNGGRRSPFHQQDFPDTIQIERHRFDPNWVDAAGASATSRGAPARPDPIGRVHAIARRRAGSGTGGRPPRGGVALVVTEPLEGRPPPVYRDGLVLQVLDQRLLPAQEVWLTFEKPPRSRWRSGNGGPRAPSIGVAAAYGAAFLDEERCHDDAHGAIRDRSQRARRDAADRREPVRGARAGRCGFGSPRTSRRMDRTALLEEPTRSRRSPRLSQRSAARRGVHTAARPCSPLQRGGLATGGYCSALGVVRAPSSRGRRSASWPPRPALSKLRLTAWSSRATNPRRRHHRRYERPLPLPRRSGGGRRRADRIAANGDVANKIGTYTHAVLAKENGVPFYVAAPTTTIDLTCPGAPRSRSKSDPPMRSFRSRATPSPRPRASERATPLSKSPRAVHRGDRYERESAAPRTRSRSRRRCTRGRAVGPARGSGARAVLARR